MTWHATERVSDRLHMSNEEVVKILDDDLAVLIATDFGTLHKLFYSIHDDSFFVAIVDEKNSEIITIKPYQFRLRFEVDPNSLERAKELAIHGKKAALKQNEGIPYAQPSVIRVFATYLNTRDMSRHYRVVKKFQMSVVGTDLDRLAKDENVLKQIENSLYTILTREHRLLDLVFKVGSKPPNWIIKEIDLRLFSRFC